MAMGDPDCLVLIRALHKLQLLCDGPVGVLLEHLVCLMHPSHATHPGAHSSGAIKPYDRRACVVNVAVLHDMLAEQLVEILISAVESLSKQPAQKRPAQKHAAWDRLSADWKVLDETKWQADPVAAVLAARAAAAEALLKKGELSVEGWQPPEDPRLQAN